MSGREGKFSPNDIVLMLAMGTYCAFMLLACAFVFIHKRKPRNTADDGDAQVA